MPVQALSGPPRFGATVVVDSDGIADVWGWKKAKAVRGKADALRKALKNLPDSKVRVDIVPGQVTRHAEFSGRPMWDESVLKGVIRTVGEDGVLRQTDVRQAKGWHNGWLMFTFQEDEPLWSLFRRIKNSTQDFVKTYGVQQPAKKP